jgi:DNA-binding beta-propeller fold protein YncE
MFYQYGRNCVLLLASFAASLVIPNVNAEAGMMLTSAGVNEGFSLSTFATGFASAGTAGGNAGPLGIAFAAGKVLVTDFPDSSVHIFPSDTDNQNATTVPSIPYGSVGANSLATVGDVIYMGEQNAGRLIQINPDGTFNQTILTGLNHPTGMIVNPANGHLFLSNQFSNQILDIDPINKTSNVLISSVVGPDGLSLSPDGHTLYVASNNHILGFDIATHSQVFDSGIVNSVDGTIAGIGPLAGLVFGNTNDGRFVQVNLTTLAQTVIANGGSRGDYVTLDQSNGTLMMTQSDRILRLAPPVGGFSAPEPSSILLLGIGLLSVVACRCWRIGPRIGRQDQ